jgi:hypothetical protein
MGSGRKTIETRTKAHKPAVSGATVGNGTSFCSLNEVMLTALKQTHRAPFNRRKGNV